jgi:hypothetical protein
MMMPPSSPLGTVTMAACNTLAKAMLMKRGE